MIKKLISFTRWLAIPVLTSVLATGCVQIPVETHKSPVSVETRQGVPPGIDNVLSAFQKNDYELLKGVLAENLQKEFSQETFSQSLQQLQKTLGTIDHFEYWGELKTPVLRTLVWKVCFYRHGSDKQVIEQEVLFRALIAPLDGKNRVISFGFL